LGGGNRIADFRKSGIRARRDINQVANYTLVAWRFNVDISDRPTEEYAPALDHRFPREEPSHVHRLHALPKQWCRMGYKEFATEEVRRMGAIIQERFVRLPQFSL